MSKFLIENARKMDWDTQAAIDCFRELAYEDFKQPQIDNCSKEQFLCVVYDTIQVFMEEYEEKFGEVDSSEKKKLESAANCFTELTGTGFMFGDPADSKYIKMYLDGSLRSKANDEDDEEDDEDDEDSLDDEDKEFWDQIRKLAKKLNIVEDKNLSQECFDNEYKKDHGKKYAEDDEMCNLKEVEEFFSKHPEAKRFCIDDAYGGCVSIVLGLN